MTKYQYEEGKTYLSESTPITVSRIPSGTYKISVKKDDAVGEYTLTTAPGTQNVSIMAINNDWDFSNMKITIHYEPVDEFSSFNVFTISGITGSEPICTSLKLKMGGYYEETHDVSDNDPNMIIKVHDGVASADVGDSAWITLYDSEGNLIGESDEYILIEA